MLKNILIKYELKGKRKTMFFRSIRVKRYIELYQWFLDHHVKFEVLNP